MRNEDDWETSLRLYGKYMEGLEAGRTEGWYDGYRARSNEIINERKKYFEMRKRIKRI